MKPRYPDLSVIVKATKGYTGRLEYWNAAFPPPEGWLLCDGREVHNIYPHLVEVYPELVCGVVEERIELPNFPKVTVSALREKT